MAAIQAAPRGSPPSHSIDPAERKQAVAYSKQWVDVAAALGSPRIRTHMFAHAYGICHVKDGELNDQGQAVHVDLARTFGILKKHAHKGYCSIEYDAPGDPYKTTA